VGGQVAITRRIGLLAGLCMLLSLVWAGPASVHAAAAVLPPEFTETQMVSGLARPYQMEFAPDGRLFVTQQGGKLKVIKDGVLLSQPFLTVTVDTSGDRGLIGIAFDPNFAANPYVYVYYTATTPTIHNRVSRFRAAGDVAVAGSEEILLDIDDLKTSTTHNGGAIHFGTDGKLYIATGENAQQSGTVAQSMTSLLGKMLRINPDGSIPSDNPFYTTTTGKYRAIWALGLRNPFTFAIQPGTGRMHINDVGAGTWEEINLGRAGANYGWPATEGPTTNPLYDSPIYAYGHGWTDTTGCAISGGAFYNSPAAQFPSDYTGDYFFADYCTGWMRKLDAGTNTADGFITGIEGPIDIKVGPDGALYYLTRLNGVSGNPGSVYRVQHSGVPAISTQPVDVTVAPGEPATFSVTASGQQPLSYQWQRDGVDIPGATSSSYTLPAAAASDNGAQFRVVVSNTAGTATSSSATLTVTAGSGPVATISTPAEGTRYNAGDTITFTGSGTDAEDGDLPASAYAWDVVFYHHTHTHPGPAIGPGPTGDARSGSFVIPDEGETDTDVFYRIALTVTDSSGLSYTATRDVVPNVVTLSVNATPTSPDDGLQVTVDGQPKMTPYATTSVVGMKRTIGAVSPQTLGTTQYLFDSWSDGGAETHEIVTPATDTTYTAAYRVGDSTPPETTIDSGPTVTNDTTPDFTFSSSEPGSTFQCQVDTAGWEACTSPRTLATQAQGAHTFWVRAIDGAGNVDPTPASRPFTVDTTKPTVSLTSPTAGSTVSGTISLAAAASDAVGVTAAKWFVDGVEVASDYDGAPWTKSWDTNKVVDGSHKIYAKARDAAGNWGTSATASFTVRNATGGALETTIDSGPTVTNDTTPDFAFSSNQAGSTFECMVDTGSWQACSSPTTLATLTEGSHTFSVRATAGGVTDPTPASRTFTVDITKPTVTATAPAGGSTVSGVIMLEATAADATGVTGVKWYVDGIEVVSDYDGAPWSRSWSTTGVANGSHKLFAKARDAAGNWGTSKTISFTVSNP
jgi:glucose/arabinose dehydrogenase